ncbi:MAG: hypothetical protein R3E89_02650 [Thiolinea sp.]
MQARTASYPDLILYQRLALTYTFPMYFFISPQHPELATRLETGLKTLLDNGKFDLYLEGHPVTRSLFPLEKWQETLAFAIDNPFLPEETPLQDSRLWLTLPFTETGK